MSEAKVPHPEAVGLRSRTKKNKAGGNYTDHKEEDEWPSFTHKDVGEHAAEKDLFVTVHGKVYDMSKFAKLHPGGKEILIKHAGKDATEAFDLAFHSEKAQAMTKKYMLGHMKGYKGDGGGLPNSKVVPLDSVDLPKIWSVLVYSIIGLAALYKWFTKGLAPWNVESPDFLWRQD